MSDRHVHIDPVGGLAGDMFVASAIDAGLLTRTRLQSLLEGLAVEGELDFEIRRARRGSLTGARLQLSLPESRRRDFADIRELLAESDLPDGVRDRAQALFRVLAEAEGEIHGVPTTEVHFHEVGALDSIVDFVASAAIIEETASSWSVGTIPLGTGSIETSHGEMPVPAPATAALLQGFHVKRTDTEAELVTPTGAAILRHLRDAGLLTDHGDEGRVEAIGYGAGSRKIEGLNNVVRLLVFSHETAESDTGTTRESVTRIVCDVDDRSPEYLAHLAELLMERGAIDVTRSSVHMKKGRVGTRMSILAEPEEVEGLLDAVFGEGLTLGVRVQRIPRRTLVRDQKEVVTRYGPVRVKIGRWKGEPVRVDPEFEDCKRLAIEGDVALRRVFDDARQEAFRLLEDADDIQMGEGSMGTKEREDR